MLLNNSSIKKINEEEGNILFNDMLNTFYMASDIWLKTTR